MKPGLFFDAVVVGAGPAGSVAAYEIARAGFSALLLEKHRRVGVPVCCAEAITTEGLTRVVPLNPRWVACPISGILLAVPGGEGIHLRHPDAGFVLHREIFDVDLAKRAADAGAVLWTGAEATGIVAGNGRLFDRVIVRREGVTQAIGCRIILGCDGIESLVGRWAGLNTAATPETMDTAAQYLLGGLRDIVPGRVEFHFSAGLAPGGYAWVFPKSATTANVGLGFAPSLGDGRAALTRLDEFVARRFGKADIRATSGGGVPAFCGRKFMVAGNVLLAGDAARLVDSLSGAGIANALLSGQYAGQTATQYLHDAKKKAAILKTYPERFMKVKGRELRYFRFAREILMRMTDRDFDDVVELLKPSLDGRTFHDINGMAIIKQILRARPRLLRLARHLVW